MEVVSQPLAGAVVIKPAGKDSRWLTLEVCREFARANCPRSAEECKYAHPPPHVEIQNGRVTCCYDSIKGKCQRTNPPCKYLHPPSHLQEQLLQTGKQNLALKNLQAAQAVAVAGLPPMLQMAGSSSVYPVMYSDMLKTVLPSTYPTMMIPPQYQYMPFNPVNQQLMQAGNVVAGSSLSPYQLYAPMAAQPTALSLPQSTPTAAAATAVNPYLQFIDTLGQPAGSMSAMSMPVNGTQLYTVPGSGQIYNMTGSNQLEMWNPLGSYADTAVASNGTAEQQASTKSLQQADATSAIMYKELAVPQGATSSSIAYQQAMPIFSAVGSPTDQVTVQTAAAAAATAGRKRPMNSTDDLLLGMQAIGAAASSKRPALIDTKTGLPVYQPVANVQSTFALPGSAQPRYYGHVTVPDD